ncbi:hypothetical protein FOA52_006533 [Chlamydomonas sp. UWO 241]|nr:hypothetical protein FOA52_006533 [Chlamydomonas sp. UWO 241]
MGVAGDSGQASISNPSTTVPAGQDAGASAGCTTARLRQLLRDNFGFDAFRPLQEEAILAALSGRDSFVLLPTGGGKSMCYTLPALASGRMVVVVSPLIALMQDQVAALVSRGVPAAYISSSQTAAERRSVDAVLEGALVGTGAAPAGHRHATASSGVTPLPPLPPVLYVTPELLATSTFSRVLGALHGRGRLALLAIDEAHCISSWGHQFRPTYRKLRDARRLLPGLPVMALTATADARVQADIIQQLRLAPDCAHLVASFNRPNITYSVLLVDVLAAGRARAEDADADGDGYDLTVDAAAYGAVKDLVEEAVRGGRTAADATATAGAAAMGRRDAGAPPLSGCAIVYTHKRATASELAARLAGDGLRAAGYSAKLSPRTRSDVLSQWRLGQLDVVVATVAFGMGIDRRADRGQMITIVSAYSPTEAASDEEAGDFYLRVAALADKANDKRDLLIVAGGSQRRAWDSSQLRRPAVRREFNLQLSDRFGLLEAVPPEGADAQAEYDAMAAAIREVATNHLAPRGSRRRRGWQFTLSQRTLRLMDARQRAHTAWLRSKSAAAKRERNRANRAADAAVQRDRERWIGQQVAEAQDMLRKKNLRQFARACDRLAGRSRSHQIPPAMRDVSGALHSGPDGVLKAMTESFDKLYGGETKLSDETLNQLENDVAAFELTRATEVDEAHGRPPDLAETEAYVRLVLHYNLPQTIEGFYQESGRAGRDGLPARSVLLFSLRDCSKMDYLLRMVAKEQESKSRKQAPAARAPAANAPTTKPEKGQARARTEAHVHAQADAGSSGSMGGGSEASEAGGGGAVTVRVKSEGGLAPKQQSGATASGSLVLVKSEQGAASAAGTPGRVTHEQGAAGAPVRVESEEGAAAAPVRVKREEVAASAAGKRVRVKSEEDAAAVPVRVKSEQGAAGAPGGMKSEEGATSAAGAPVRVNSKKGAATVAVKAEVKAEVNNSVRPAAAAAAPEDAAASEIGGGEPHDQRACAAFAKVVVYARRARCRRAALLAHFGEGLPGSDEGGGGGGCRTGCCDVCVDAGTSVREQLDAMGGLELQRRRQRESRYRRGGAHTFGHGGGIALPARDNSFLDLDRSSDEGEGGGGSDDCDWGGVPVSEETAAAEAAASKALACAGARTDPGGGTPKHGRSEGGGGASVSGRGRGGADAELDYLSQMEDMERRYDKRARADEASARGSGDALARLATAGGGAGGSRGDAGAASAAWRDKTASHLARVLRDNARLSAGLPDSALAIVAGVLAAAAEAGGSAATHRSRATHSVSRAKAAASVFALPEVMAQAAAGGRRGGSSGGGDANGVVGDLLVAEVHAVCGQWGALSAGCVAGSSSANEGGVDEAEGCAALAARVSALSAVPVTEALLTKPHNLGKAMAKMAKHTCAAEHAQGSSDNNARYRAGLAAAAGGVVAAWRACVVALREGAE